MQVSMFGDGKYFNVYRQNGQEEIVVVAPTPYLTALLEFVEKTKRDAERFQAYLDSMEEKDGTGV